LDAIRGKEILHYVARETIEEIQLIPDRTGYDRTDYFIKFSDGPRDMNGVSISIDQVEALDPDTVASIVTIVYINRFGGRHPDRVIVVIVKKIEGNLKIFKCIDTFPEA